MDASRDNLRVFVTGATGFVGRYVVRELVARGHRPVCLTRSEGKLLDVFEPSERDRIDTVRGTLFDGEAIALGASGAGAAIHLVGIIAERGDQTFDRVHRRGTEAVLEAVRNAGVKRYVHMSALGSRLAAPSAYHRSKWAAEEAVRRSGLEWTIFQPSLIHGPDGEFIRMLRSLACGFFPPVMPYFGRGRHRLQPVDVRDVAHCFVEALRRSETAEQTYELGGPRTYTWRELYSVARCLLPCARKWKPMVGQPVLIARLMAATIMKTPFVPDKYRFNKAQILMSQEDSICDQTRAERAIDISFRDFEQELAAYSSEIDRS